MTHILSWLQAAQAIKDSCREKASKFFSWKSVYVAIIFLWDNVWSKAYVRLKSQFGADIWVPVQVFGQGLEQTYTTHHQIIELCHFLNADPHCVGIVVQLPLPEALMPYKAEILAAIHPHKDIDGLGGMLVWLSSIDLIDFIPATPKAVWELLKRYNLHDVKGKTVSVLGQSNLVGKPFAMHCIKYGATVYSFNHFLDPKQVQEVTKKSDYIVSCTGQVHLIDKNYVRDDKTQVIIDVWYGKKDGKPVGDVHIEEIKDMVAAYSPVPGGVGPLTVACLFANIFVLQEQKDRFSLDMFG